MNAISPPRGAAVTIGTFDGVHVGHQQLFHRLQQSACRDGLETCAVVFRNQPRSVLSPDVEVEYITTWRERKALIERQAVRHIVPLDFTEALARTSAAEFVEALVSRLKMRLLVVGPDFALGHRRQGDIKFLTEMGQQLGFDVEVVEPKSVEGQPIRSRVLRRLIRDGQVCRAAVLLGRRYSLTGVVVEGDRRGRELGFPTANLSLEPLLMSPRRGIYATWACVDGRRMPSATSIGVRPTFGEGPQTIEVYVMDFSGDLYGKEMALEFAEMLRDEEEFASVDALLTQMRHDVSQARLTLAAQAGQPS